MNLIERAKHAAEEEARQQTTQAEERNKAKIRTDIESKSSDLIGALKDCLGIEAQTSDFVTDLSVPDGQGLQTVTMIYRVDDLDLTFCWHYKHRGLVVLFPCERCGNRIRSAVIFSVADLGRAIESPHNMGNYDHQCPTDPDNWSADKREARIKEIADQRSVRVEKEPALTLLDDIRRIEDRLDEHGDPNGTESTRAALMVARAVEGLRQVVVGGVGIMNVGQ